MSLLYLKTMPLIFPNGSVPSHIKACSTLRYPGESQGVYAGFNLGTHVGDDANHVNANRQNLIQLANLPSEPKWLEQIHSTHAVLAESIPADSKEIIQADASYTQQKNIVCAVMTADCLPILVTNESGTEIAAIHAGWKGLASGVIEKTLEKLNSKSESLIIWIAPSISKNYYEVGEDVYNAFAEKHTMEECELAFEFKMLDMPMQNLNNNQKDSEKKWLADMPLLAQQRLIRLGVNAHNIYLSNECTYKQSDSYFSYRRDGVTGRMASLIWMS